MPVQDADRKIVETVFQAMHERADGRDKMVSLFAADAELTEPFSGETKTHKGLEAIGAFFDGAVADMPPDMTIKMDRIDLDGDRVRAEWTCTSQAFGGPMKGHDLYRIVGGKIVNAEFVVTEMPSMGG